MPQPTAYMIHGFLGVGKTTFAKTLEAERDAIRFTHDEWMRRLHGVDPPAARFADYAIRISGLMEDVWTRCLELGCSVILDSGFWARAERMRVRAIISAHGAEPVLYRLTCPDNVARRRIEARNGCPGDGLYIAPRTYAALKGKFEPLEPDEPRIDITPT